MKFHSKVEHQKTTKTEVLEFIRTEGNGGFEMEERINYSLQSKYSIGTSPIVAMILFYIEVSFETSLLLRMKARVTFIHWRLPSQSPKCLSLSRQLMHFFLTTLVFFFINILIFHSHHWAFRPRHRIWMVFQLWSDILMMQMFHSYLSYE